MTNKEALIIAIKSMNAELAVDFIEHLIDEKIAEQRVQFTAHQPINPFETQSVICYQPAPPQIPIEMPSDTPRRPVRYRDNQTKHDVKGRGHYGDGVQPGE